MESAEILAKRESILEVLAAFADLDAQREMQSENTDISLPSELVSLWMERYNPSDEDVLMDVFTLEERESLLEFNTQLESKLSELPDSSSIEVWMESQVWQSIAADAGQALGSFVS